MDTNYLVEFVELAKRLSFTETSRSLGMNQPTLSKHIAALEEKSEEAGRYRQSLCETIRRRTMLAQPQMPPALLEKSIAPLTVTELEELAALMKQQAEKRFAPVVQTAPAPENETDNRAFCI